MHSAPAVRYPVARSAWAGAWLLGLWLAAATVCLWWWLPGGASRWQALAVAASWCIGAAVSLVQWRRSPVGHLRWDGQAWWWQCADEDEVSVKVQVRLDLQQRMLVEMTGSRRPDAWCWLEHAALPAGWADMRRALYSSASATPERGAILP